MRALITPIPAHRRVSRFTNLAAGLSLFGVSIALMLSAGLGVDSWDVLHQGLASRLGISFGLVVNGVAVIALAGWIPLRQRPGIGTIANVIIIGIVADLTLAVLPDQRFLPAQLGVLGAGILTNAIATGLYIGAGLGPGPRDGLMTGLSHTTGRSIRFVRTIIEISVLAIGWLIGGPVGVGTVLFAVSIGPLAQHFMRTLAIELDQDAVRPEASAATTRPSDKRREG